MTLKILKKGNSIEVTDFALTRSIDSEPAFLWWVPDSLCKCDYIINAVNTWVAKTTHKSGIKILHTVYEVFKLDATNNNTILCDALNKEMDSLKVRFDILPWWNITPPRWNIILVE